MEFLHILLCYLISVSSEYMNLGLLLCEEHIECREIRAD
jgi:hypothetical protein